MFPGQDKLAHAAVFGILGVLFIQGLGPRDSPFSVWKVLLITAMVAAFGALDEIHQSFVPGRDASLGDLAADAAGGFAAAVVFRIRSSFTRARPRTDGKLKDKPRNMAGGHKHPIVCP
jgi:VanZ family protein